MVFQEDIQQAMVMYHHPSLQLQATLIVKLQNVSIMMHANVMPERSAWKEVRRVSVKKQNAQLLHADAINFLQ